MAAGPGPGRGTSRRALLRCAAALPVVLDGRHAGAEGRSVTLLVGATPGGAADEWARGFAPFLERHWPGSSVAVRNLPGEDGLAAMRALAAAQADGRLIGAVSTPLLLARAVQRSETALLDGLHFVAAVVEEPVVLIANPDLAEDLAALRALGPRTILGTPSAGSAAQLAATAFSRTAPMDLLAFPNASAARQAVLAGHIPCAMVAISEVVAPLRKGRLAGLAIARKQRSRLAPEVPTFMEQGIALAVTSQRGFAVAAGTAPAAEEPVLQGLRSAVADPEFTAQAEALGVEPSFIARSEWEPELRRTLADLTARWVRDPWITRQE